MATLKYRFDKRVMPCPTSGCWFWMGYMNKGGYGVLRGSRGTMGAHRWFYEQVKGPIPDGMVINHICRVRLCVNPDHLEAVTQKQNIYADGSMCLASENIKKECCPKCGGDYTPIGNNKRICKPCSAAYKADYHIKHRERILALMSEYHSQNKDRLNARRRARGYKKNTESR